MYQQVKFQVINPDLINDDDEEGKCFGGIAIVDDNGTITNVICGCCGSVFEPEDIKIIDRYDDWMDLSWVIIS
jgi:transcription elongation factor Elf1